MTRDALTGLLNRDGLTTRAARLQQSAPGILLVRLTIDLDAVHVAHGHGVAGELLGAVAARLDLHVEPLNGLAARLHDADFAVLLPLPLGAIAYPSAWANHQVATLRTRVTVPDHRLGSHTVAVAAAVSSVMAAGGAAQHRWDLEDLLTAAGTSTPDPRFHPVGAVDGANALARALRVDHLLAPAAALAAAGAEPFRED